MQVKEVMTKHVEVVRATDTLQAAAEKMRAQDVGILPVHDDSQAVGMVSDRDMAVRGVAQGKDPTRARVGEVMTPELVCVNEDQDIADAADLMEQRQVRRALVLGKDGTIAGIVSLGDLAVRVRGSEEELCSEVLRKVSEPSPHVP